MSPVEFCTVLDHAVDGPGTQNALVGALVDIHERWLRPRPGYRGTQFLASPDGCRLQSIVRWATESDFQAFETSSDHAQAMADIQHTLDRLPGLTDTSVGRYRLMHRVGSSAR